MSDTAIFITLSLDELSSNGQLPGDLRSLRNLTTNDERVIHLEVISDAPLPEKTATMLHAAGALVTTLPAASDSSAALVGGLMARLHEFICAYSHVSQFILAGSDSDRLSTPASFLQRAGYYVIVAGSDRGRLDSLRLVTDDLSVWTGRPPKREDNTPQLDPYEVLVDEVTRGREKGQRVLLTSLKQRMRRRMRRFDETRMKDQEGRPMRKFKDFIADAASRNLIQLIENGNRSHVLLPGEDIPEETDEEETTTEEQTPRKSRNSGRNRRNNDRDDDSDDTSSSDNRSDNRSHKRRDDDSDDSDSDPLLDAVDMVDGDQVDSVEEAEQDIPELSETDFDVGSVNEDAPAPPTEFMEILENAIPGKGLTLTELLKMIAEKKAKEEIKASNREICDMLQNAFYNELLEPINEDQPSRFVIVDDWKGIIDFL